MFYREGSIIVAEAVKADLPVKTRWAIAPDWFPLNHRSITTILQSYLCPECAKKFHSEDKKCTPESLIATINNCCSHSPGFMNDKLPVLEEIFRFFLTNGNSPVTIEELGEQMNRICGGNAYHNSPATLLRVLRTDMYYGLQEIPD